MSVYTHVCIVDIEEKPGGVGVRMNKKFSLTVFLHDQIT